MVGQTTKEDIQDGDIAIQEYRMHVSQRYLDLTRKKLELARIPKEVLDETAADSSITKDDIEPLLDFWLERYDFRAEERKYNDTLPQFRTDIEVDRSLYTKRKQETLRLHFVHKPSTHENALPLLICHDWGSSYLEVARVIDSLTNPVTTPPIGNEHTQAFDVICPSIPGFGYSDTSKHAAFGIADTARAYHALMKKLGYTAYVVYGTGWGFRICEEIARLHPSSCLAVYTVNPTVPRPTLNTCPIALLKYWIARLTGARTSVFSFGYVPSDFSLTKQTQADPGFGSSGIDTTDTLPYALADSPSGLLAFMLNVIRPNKVQMNKQILPRGRSDSAMQLPMFWSPSEILTWTMLYWLSGPEAPLRWLGNAQREAAPRGRFWTGYSRVPLGISFFRPADSRTIVCPPMWTSAYHNLRSLRRHENGRHVDWPMWEAPDEVVLDLRDFVRDLKEQSRLTS